MKRAQHDSESKWVIKDFCRCLKEAFFSQEETKREEKSSTVGSFCYNKHRAHIANIFLNEGTKEDLLKALNIVKHKSKHSYALENAIP